MDGNAPKPWDENLECKALPSGNLEAAEIPKQGSLPQAEDLALASVWQMESPADADAALNGEAFVYRRDGHPNADSLARRLGELHGGTRALLTAQGMSAIGAIALATLKPGATVWVADELYGKSVHLLHTEMTRWQVDTQIFDPTSSQDLERLRAANADLIMVETISNPRLKLPDLRELAELSREQEAILVVDNTFATHLLCQPLSHGADLVVESLGKQVNGHSDAMVGLVVGRDDALMERISSTISTYGMASSPLDCYLTHRGLMSLGVRMQRVCANAMALAEFLAEHSGVKNVDYPGLSGHSQHALATGLLRGGFGWMVSFEIEPSEEKVLAFLERLRPEIAFVPSLGDVATTISHPATTSHRGFTEAERKRLGISFGTIRVSCGLEPTEWLLEKFARAI